MLNGKDALIVILNGGIVEMGKRYYRYNVTENIIQYSDNKENWKRSDIIVNDFLMVMWNKV